MSKPAGEKVNSVGDRLFVLVFSATLFCSASLMFCLQPMVGKLLLPRLGGTPQVWSTCMVFFQAMLLAGYLHAHYTGILFGLRWQAAVHLILIGCAVFTLPLGMSEMAMAPDVNHPTLWLMHVLLFSVGAPMFVISSTAPLLQKWFSHTHHPTARDPYYLYAASNLGSLLALLSYPFIVEPYLDLGRQARLFSGVFVILAIFVAACAFLFYRNYSPRPVEAPSSDENDVVTWSRRLRWLLLSFAPSSLLLGVTTYITTDIAVTPLLWIAPLALYLATFVLAFAKEPLIPHRYVVKWQLIFVLALVMLNLALGAQSNLWLKLGAHLAAFFTTALMCHGELMRSRPGTAHLTEFYLWLSFGGVLGGAFNALLAPAIFVLPIEYPLALMLACLLRPSGDAKDGFKKRLGALLPLLMLALVLLVVQFFKTETAVSTWAPMAIVWVMTLVVCLGFGDLSRHLVKLGAGFVLALVVILLLPGVSQITPFQIATESTWRSFFGIYKIAYDSKRDVNLLVHGTTSHGAQLRNPKLAKLPIAYYHLGGPFGDLFDALADKLRRGQVAVMGLGVGGLTCYGTRDSVWTYYEIDPLVEKIARDSRYFTYLRDCSAKVNVVIGDARLKLQEAADHQYDLIVGDAFSSDAIPTHLLTREAIAGYLKKLAPDGVIAIQVTNNYMNLEPVIASLAMDAHLVGRVNRSLHGDRTKGGFGLPARLVVLARSKGALGAIAESPGWRSLISYPNRRVWSDDYINILSVLERPSISNE